MFNTDLEEKRRIIAKRIERELSQYYAQHKKGLPAQMLSAKYAKSLIELGGFPEFLEELKTAGRLHVEYSENGARSIFPAHAKITVVSAKKVWF